MHYHSSTMEASLRCHNCGRWLKETEAYFNHNQCTECNYQELKKHIETNQRSVNNVQSIYKNMVD